MNTIYKYILKDPKNTISMPKGARIISVDEQRGDICAWAVLDTKQTIKEDKVIYVFGTGWETEKDLFNLGFLGTVKIDGGRYIFHVFEAIATKVKFYGRK